MKHKKLQHNKGFERAPLVEALRNVHLNPNYQFHIPGHTKGVGVFSEFKNLVGKKALEIDTTDEFDDLGTLYPATGPINAAQELAAKAFGAKRTFFLVNGSTVGNIALAMALSKAGDKVIVNRNCHRSILTGLIVTGANPLWLMPKRLENWGLWGCVSASDAEELLRENRNVSLVWITNPTYEGVVSDIKSISEVCKKYNVPLVVDEAHGCLWKFSDELPTSSLELGADAVVHSLHKTGGSMSQSSMLHLGQNSNIDCERVEKSLRLLQSTSPSVLLLASLDAARAHLESDKGQKQIKSAVNNAIYFRKRMKNIPKLSVLDDCSDFDIDKTKIFIRRQGISGIQLASVLKDDYNIEIESATDNGVLLLSNIGNKRSEFAYLADCFEAISSRDFNPESVSEKKYMPMLKPEIKINLHDAFYAPKEVLQVEHSVGRVCAEVIAECPPGISILVPGELITPEHLPYLKSYENIEVLK